MVSPDAAEGSLTIGQDARLYAGLLAPGATIEHAAGEGRASWLHVARGRIELNGEELGPGDGAGIREEARLELRGVEDAELVLWELKG